MQYRLELAATGMRNNEAADMATGERLRLLREQKARRRQFAPKLMHEIVIPKDTHVFVSISAANTNPAIWGPDGREWKPERWLSPLPDAVSEARIPGVYSNL